MDGGILGCLLQTPDERRKASTRKVYFDVKIWSTWKGFLCGGLSSRDIDCPSRESVLGIYFNQFRTSSRCASSKRAMPVMGCEKVEGGDDVKTVPGHEPRRLKYGRDTLRDPAKRILLDSGEVRIRYRVASLIGQLLHVSGRGENESAVDKTVARLHRTCVKSRQPCPDVVIERNRSYDPGSCPRPLFVDPPVGRARVRLVEGVLNDKVQNLPGSPKE